MLKVGIWTACTARIVAKIWNSWGRPVLPKMVSSIVVETIWPNLENIANVVESQLSGGNWWCECPKQCHQLIQCHQTHPLIPAFFTSIVCFFPSPLSPYYNILLFCRFHLHILRTNVDPGWAVHGWTNGTTWWPTFLPRYLLIAPQIVAIYNNSSRMVFL